MSLFSSLSTKAQTVLSILLLFGGCGGNRNVVADLSLYTLADDENSVLVTHQILPLAYFQVSAGNLVDVGVMTAAPAVSSQSTISAKDTCGDGRVFSCLLEGIVSSAMEETSAEATSRAEANLAGKQEFLGRLGLADPSVKLASVVLGLASSRIGEARLYLTPDDLSVYDPFATKGKRFILHVSTELWGLEEPRQDPELLGHRRPKHVFYEGHVRLVDVNESKVLSEARCSYESREAFSFDQLITESGALLKSEISESVATCAKQYVDRIGTTLATVAKGK